MRFYGAIAGGRAKVKGFSRKAARDSLRGVKMNALPPRTGNRPPGVGGAAKLGKSVGRKRKRRRLL
jgi:hypothetical protein